MKRILIALAASAVLTGSAFAQTANTLASCADYNAADAEMKMEMAAKFQEDLLANSALQSEIGETPGDGTAETRMDQLNTACEANPNGTLYQAVQAVSGN